MSEDSKWECLSCTYKNYPASRKCVMCSSQRPAHIISDLENAEQDIYKVAALEAKNARSPLNNRDLENKWQCAFCTFPNFTALRKCSQCNNLKKFEDISADTSTQGSSKTPTIKTQPTSCGSMTQQSVVSPNTQGSQWNEHTSVDLNKPSSTFVKWSCNACTYENYLPSKTCFICHTPKNSYQSMNSSSASGSSTESIGSELPLYVDVDSKNKENIKSGQNSPIRSSSSEQKNNKSDYLSSQNNRSGQIVSANNNRGCVGNRSGQNSPNAPSGQISPHNLNNVNLKQGHIIPYKTNGKNSPKQLSPQNNRSRHISPQDGVSAQISLSNIGHPLPINVGVSKSNKNKMRMRNDILYINDCAGAIGGSREDDRRERHLQKLRKKLSTEDLIWLNACEAVVAGDPNGIEQYLTSGGDPSRQLTRDEVLILEHPSAFEVGHTLVHLALRFRRDDMVAILLAATDIGAKGFKRLPSYTCPELSSDIRREISMMLRQCKGGFPCFFLTDCSTFALPADIEDLPRDIQTQLFDEMFDTDVEKELTDECVINWSIEITEKLGSRLYALWNRTAGDCLLDSVLQATWGILDIDNTLRRAMSDSLSEAAYSFYPKWKDYETMQAHMMNFSLDEGQWQRDWAFLLSLASQPGTSLEQMHVFALAHILRRPIIVYGVKMVKSYKGETIDFARFEGVYLPLLWEWNFCFKSPIALGYTRGHFSALVPMEMDTNISLGAGANIENTMGEQVFYLPLVDHENTFLPIHFITEIELGQEETLLRKWLDCLVTQDGLFVAIQKIGKYPPSVIQMLQGWLDYYRNLGTVETNRVQGLSSDGESDQD